MYTRSLCVLGGGSSMTKEKMEAVYRSKYCPEEKLVTVAQYITELVCEKKAFNEGRELPYRFWDHKDWHKYFRWQIKIANQLLAQHDERDILGAMRDDRCKKMLSLTNGNFKKVIQEKKSERMHQEVELVEVEEKELTKPQKPFGKSLLGKLKDG